MSGMTMWHEPFGPGYQVEPCVNWPGMDHVGLIASPERGRGWVELTVAEARALAVALLRAARETEDAAVAVAAADVKVAS